MSKLYLVGTPIGNLEDITLRALRILGEVDLIAAEDTRQTVKLLNHYEIKKPLIAYHQHNEKRQGVALLERLLGGEQVAVVTDAGMPGISDPGAHLVRLALEAGVPIEVIPGPTAFVTALVGSGLPTERFLFEGFLPRKQKEQAARLALLAGLPHTLLFYEAPHRLVATLKALLAGLGDRPATVARELTKKFEEVRRGPLSQLLAHFEAVAPRGEFVILVEGAEATPEPLGEVDYVAEVAALEAAGVAHKEAMRQVAQQHGVSRREVYQALLTAKQD